VQCYLSDVVKICSLRGNVTPVYGITVVDQLLFVVRAWSTDIEVYDASAYCLLRRLSVPHLRDVTDMAGCQHHRCLYLADCEGRALHTVSLEDVQAAGQWSLGDKPYGVSVTPRGHVVVSFCETSVVTMFTNAGDLLRQVAVDQVVNLRHAVVRDTGQLVICHGSLQLTAGVSIIDAEGHVVKTVPAEPGSTQLGWPTHVGVDHRGFIYVTDYTNRRVLQFDPDLTYVADIEQEQRNPRSICIDSTARRMYVAESGGSVHIYGLQYSQ